MYKFKSLTFDDFYFNNKKLSDLGGIVASSDGGLKQYSLLPSRSYVTDRPLGSDVATVYASYLEGRAFEVPIFFDQLTDGKIRELAMWLDTPTTGKFQWVGDDVYINAYLDSTDFAVNSISGQDGSIPLKFIAYDPFFYSIDQTQYIHASENFTSGQTYNGTNDGYGTLDPIIKISGSGTIKVEVFDSENNPYTTTNVTGVIAGVTINSETQECKLYSGANHFNNIDNFPEIPNGNFTYKITGDNISNVEITFREKYL